MSSPRLTRAIYGRNHEDVWLEVHQRMNLYAAGTDDPGRERRDRVQVVADQAGELRPDALMP